MDNEQYIVHFRHSHEINHQNERQTDNPQRNLHDFEQHFYFLELKRRDDIHLAVLLLDMLVL